MGHRLPASPANLAPFRQVWQGSPLLLFSPGWACGRCRAPPSHVAQLKHDFRERQGSFSLDSLNAVDLERPQAIASSSFLDREGVLQLVLQHRLAPPFPNHRAPGWHGQNVRSPPRHWGISGQRLTRAASQAGFPLWGDLPQRRVIPHRRCWRRLRKNRGVDPLEDRNVGLRAPADVAPGLQPFPGQRKGCPEPPVHTAVHRAPLWTSAAEGKAGNFHGAEWG